MTLTQRGLLVTGSSGLRIECPIAPGTTCQKACGLRGSLKETQFEKRLTLLGVSSSKARKKIRILTVSNTLALLKHFHTFILRSPKWALSSLTTEIFNTQTAQLHLFKKITGPFSGLVI